MKKQVSVQSLKFGVYIHELDRPWTDTPFMFQGFILQNDRQLEVLKKHCKKVTIDTERGFDVADRPFSTAVPIGPSVLSTIEKKVTYEEKSPFATELPVARAATGKTETVLKDVFSSVAAGKAIDAPRVREAVSSMTDSVVRNPDAMLLLAKMKEKGEHTLDRALGVSIYMI